MYSYKIVKDEAVMILTKVGDCLIYGLEKEFTQKKTSGSGHDYLKSVIIYFWLQGRLSRKSVEECKILLSNTVDSVQESIRNDILEILIRELRQKIFFPDTDSFFKILNTRYIPEWIYKNRNVIWNLLPNIYMVDSLLYYIININERYYFRKVHIVRLKSAEDLTEFAQDLYEDRDGDLSNDDYENHTLSNSYCEIMAYDEIAGRFFLRMVHNYSMYAEYDIHTGQEIVHYNCRCIGIMGNNIPVVETEGNLCAVIGGRKQMIRHSDCMETYEIRKEYIVVKPRICGPVMFEPYRITLEGKREEMAYAERSEYMLEKILDDIWNPDGMLRLYRRKIKNVSVFSLAFLDTYLKEKYNLEKVKEARIYHFLVEILEQ